MRKMLGSGLRRPVAVVCMLVSVAAVGQEPATGLAARIAALVVEPAVARAHWGVMVTTMDGTPLYGLNEGQFFQPASNTKMFTTSAAVALLGPERRWTTVVEGPPGSQGATTVEGDLTLRGAGDANLSGQAVPYVEPRDRTRALEEIDPLRYLAEMADAVVAAGVKRITGDIVGDDTRFPWQPYPADWSADDLVWGYGAPVSALTITDNQLNLKITPARRAGERATVVLDPAAPEYYTLEASVTTVASRKDATVRVERALGSRVLKVYGTIAVRSGTDVEQVAIHDPAEYAAMALREMLIARGVQVDGIARARHREVEAPVSFLHEAREPLPGLPKEPVEAVKEEEVCRVDCPLRVRHVSPPLIQDVVVTNKESENLHAELLLHQLGRAYGADGSTAEGARVVRQFLVNAGLDGDDFVFYDGSGLSGHDLVTPRAVAKLLAYNATQPWFEAWKASLPVGGVDGTLEHRFTKAPLKGRIFAKTGTLGEARALSGYLECASGKTVIFSIMVDQHQPGSSADRKAMDRMVEAIAESE